MNGNMLPAIVVSCAGQGLEGLLSREWLLTNRLGSYASSSVVGCNTRRYHGLLVAATHPPVGRVATLSCVMEELEVGGKTYALATNEFSGAFSPRGCEHMVEFRNDPAPATVWRVGGAELTKEIILAEAANALAVRYTLRGAKGRLLLRPFTAMRDFHALRRASQPHQLGHEITSRGYLAVRDLHGPDLVLYLKAGGEFHQQGQWWYQFLYRQEHRPRAGRHRGSLLARALYLRTRRRRSPASSRPAPAPPWKWISTPSATAAARGWSRSPPTWATAPTSSPAAWPWPPMRSP